MHVAQREFTDEILDRISQTVRETAQLTRCALSRLVCGWMNWKDAAGRVLRPPLFRACGRRMFRGLFEPT